MEGVIYVMSNNCFMIKDHYKIGFTTDIEERKKSYITAYPVSCEWPYISEKSSNIRTRERLIFQRLKDYRFNDSREFFICPLDKIKSTVEDVFKMTLKDMNLELNIKEWKLEVPIFLKKVIKEVKTGKSYNKVLVEDLYRLFVVWCMAKNIKKKIKEEEFEKDLENYKLKQNGKVIKFKSTKTHPKEYLEMMEYNI
jgi:hypothetical protein